LRDRVVVFVDIAGNRWDLLGPASRDPRSRFSVAVRQV